MSVKKKKSCGNFLSFDINFNYLILMMFQKKEKLINRETRVV